MPAGVDERRDEPLGVVEARADHRAAGRAGGDALADDGELEEREGLVPVGVGDVEAGRARVALDHLGARREALGRGHRRDDPRRGQHVGVALLAPEREQRPEVGQRVAERAHLPVEDGHDAAGPGGVQDGVVEPVVAVHDRVDALRRQRADAVRRAARRAPAASSTRDASHCCDQRRSWRAMKPAGRPNSASPTVGRVDGVQRGEHVDERLADRAPVVRRRRRSRPAARCGRCARARAPSRRTARRARRRGTSVRGTGTAVPSSAVSTRYSRPMSCAVGRMCPSGGRRRMTSPASQATR